MSGSRKSTTRELNSNFDMRNIIDLTLRAIESPRGESGTIILDVTT